MKKQIHYLIGFFLFCNFYAPKTFCTPKICLNMIVKNEEKTIVRCLNSLKHLISYWVIVDTGSDDQTKIIINNTLKDIPGELHEKPWKNFSYNRNHALNLAKHKGDYLLFIDADEELIFSKNFFLPDLTEDYYLINAIYNDCTYKRIALVKNSLKWEWKGLVHEVIMSPEARTYQTLLGVENLIRREGCRSKDPDIFLKDAKILEEELKDDPQNSRTVYYLAQSYRDALKFTKAIEYYEKRTKMTNNDEEVFWSFLTIAQLQQMLKMPETLFIENYYKAFAARPKRAEPLYYLANHYRLKENYHEGYTLAYLGLQFYPSNEVNLVEKWIYEHGLLMEFSLCAYHLERYLDALSASETILKVNNLDKKIKDQVCTNIQFIRQKMKAENQNNHYLSNFKIQD